jgi:hypothetical protein
MAQSPTCKVLGTLEMRFDFFHQGRRLVRLFVLGVLCSSGCVVQFTGPIARSPGAGDQTRPAVFPPAAATRLKESQATREDMPSPLPKKGPYPDTSRVEARDSDRATQSAGHLPGDAHSGIGSLRRTTARPGTAREL